MLVLPSRAKQSRNSFKIWITHSLSYSERFFPKMIWFIGEVFPRTSRLIFKISNCQPFASRVSSALATIRSFFISSGSDKFTIGNNPDSVSIIHGGIQCSLFGFERTLRSTNSSPSYVIWPTITLTSAASFGGTLLPRDPLFEVARSWISTWLYLNIWSSSFFCISTMPGK